MHAGELQVLHSPLTTNSCFIASSSYCPSAKAMNHPVFKTDVSSVINNDLIRQTHWTNISTAASKTTLSQPVY